MSYLTPFENTGAVEFALKKIDELRSKIADFQEQAQAFRNEVDKRLIEATTPLQDEIDVLTAQIKLFAQKHLQATGERSKLLLSGRRIGFRKGSVTFFFDDVKADKDNLPLLKFCKDHYNYNFVKSKTIETVDWANFRRSLKVLDNGKVVTVDGEIIENMRAEQADDVFFIK